MRYPEYPVRDRWRFHQPPWDIVSFAIEFGELMRKIERAASSPDVGARTSRIIVAITREPRQQVQLARDLDMDTGQIAKIARTLEDKGLLTRRPKPGKKGKLLVPTDAGRALAFSLLARQREVAGNVISGTAEHLRGRLSVAALEVGQYVNNHGWLRSQIRAVETGDIPLLVRGAMWSFCYQPFGYDPDEMEFHLLNLGVRFLAAHPAKRCGLVMEHNAVIVAGLLAIETDPGTMQIIWLGVNAHYMGKGIGREFLRMVQEQVVKMGYTILQCKSPQNEDPDLPAYLTNFSWKLKTTQPMDLCGKRVIMETWQILLQQLE